MKNLFLMLIFSVISITANAFNTTPNCPTGEEAKLIVKVFSGKTLGDVVNILSDGTLSLKKEYLSLLEGYEAKYVEDIETFNLSIKNGSTKPFSLNDNRLQIKAAAAAICACSDCPCPSSPFNSPAVCCKKVILWIFCFSYGTC